MRVRPALSVVTVSVLAALCWPSGGSALGASPVRLPDCSSTTYGGASAPVRWSLGCTGGSVNLDQLDWSDWGSATAVAHGIRQYNDCDPSCAEGTTYDFPVELRVERIKRCASAVGAALFYTHFTIVTTFPEDNAVGQPAGPSTIVYDAQCPTAGYLVAVRGKSARFGAFIERGGYDGDGLESLFGPPSSKHVNGSSCTKAWRNIGLRVFLVLYGDATDPCYSGTFRYAVLTGSRWHTISGVRPGSGAERARRDAVQRCEPVRCHGEPGYILGRHRIDCAPGLFPNVIATVKGRRVSSLIVESHVCE